MQLMWASLSMFKKKSDSLLLEEVNKFNMFIKWKLLNGEPIEEDILYNILKRLNEETTIALGYTCKRCRQIFEAFHVWER